jgi:hypothetical protein
MLKSSATSDLPAHQAVAFDQVRMMPRKAATGSRGARSFPHRRSGPTDRHP